MKFDFNKWLEEILNEGHFNIDESFKVKVGKCVYTFTYREILERIEKSKDDQIALKNEVCERSPELSSCDVLKGYLEYVSTK